MSLLYITGTLLVLMILVWPTLKFLYLHKRVSIKFTDENGNSHKQTVFLTEDDPLWLEIKKAKGL